jgi:hypothetical protein
MMRLLDAGSVMVTQRAGGRTINEIEQLEGAWCGSLGSGAGPGGRAAHDLGTGRIGTVEQLGVPFNSLVTFHRGGTITETTSSRAFAIGQRSDGQGNWSAEGHRTYSQRMVNLINFDTAPNLPFSPGFFAGWSTVSHTLRLVDADHATSSGTNEFYRTDGTLYRTGCSTAVARRFE